MRLNPLYEVKLIEANRQHYYTIGANEDWKPGVTTVISVLNKPALLPWTAKSVSDNIKETLLNKERLLCLESKSYPKEIKEYGFTEDEIIKACEEGKNIYKKKAQDAADIGTRVHKAVDMIIRGQEPVITDDIKDGVQGFIDWKESNSLEIVCGDTRLGSKLFGYGGSLDFVAFDGSDAIIFDLKTTRKRKDRSHGIYQEYGLQLAAYEKAFNETYGIPVKAVYALWVNKEKPEFKAVKISNTNVAFEAFLACLKIYQTQKFEMFDEETILA